MNNRNELYSNVNCATKRNNNLMICVQYRNPYYLAVVIIYVRNICKSPSRIQVVTLIDECQI